MATFKKKLSLLDTDEGMEIVQALHQMVEDNAYSTDSSYSANSTNYPDNLIPFVDKHINYLRQHQNMDPKQYLANLRLMTKVKHQ